MKNAIFTAILFQLFNYQVSAINSLIVTDPRNTRNVFQGTIEEASLSVRPSGVFLEYGLYLTFSSRGTPLNSSKDTLEVVLNFELPENAIVFDSWLWIGSDIVKANILDRWTASSIYEGIVNRRKDPSILFKKSASQYELRVFPMAGNSTRKVKITYLMPAFLGKQNLEAALPSTIIQTSKNATNMLSIFAFPDSIWTDPKILNDESIPFTNEKDSIFGNFKRTFVISSKLLTHPKITFKKNTNKEILLSRFQNGSESIYQLALLPDAFFENVKIRKVAVLIDFDITNTNLSVNEILNEVKQQLFINLEDRDSFNLIFSNLFVKRYSEKWISASSYNIDSVFTSLLNPLSTFSNLPALMTNGIDFVQKNGNDGMIFLLSNSDNYGEFGSANRIISDIIAVMNPKIPFHIADYQSINFPTYVFNNQFYYGNEYLYENLARLTTGSFNKVRTVLTLSNIISEAFRNISGSITSFDLHTKLDTGFCYSRFFISGKNNVTSISEPIIQIGKYKGKFPFKIEISGEYNNEIISKELAIQENEVINGDRSLVTCWTGQLIKGLESLPKSNNLVNEIITNSLQERVLSVYTAFLCVEDTNAICYDCLDESKLVNTKNTHFDLDSIIVFPNPFSDQLTVELICKTIPKQANMSIFSITGTLIHSFDVSHLTTGKNVFTWNCENLPGGIYLLNYKNSNTQKTIRLVKK